MPTLKETSPEMKAFILVQFTKEVLRHSASYDIETLEKILNKKNFEEVKKIQLEKENNREKFRKLMQERREIQSRQKLEPLIPIQKPQKFQERQKPIALPNIQRRVIEQKPAYQRPQQGVHIPTNNLPYQIQGVAPVPSDEPLNLGELTPYLNDPSVATIECNGPNTTIMVKVGRELKKTKVVLDKEEIENIVKAFSRAAKIPVHEGVFRVAIGRVIMTAQISDTTNKFIISKII